MQKKSEQADNTKKDKKVKKKFLLNKFSLKELSKKLLLIALGSILGIFLIVGIYINYQGQNIHYTFFNSNSWKPISHVTSGLIKSDSVIAVKFRHNQVFEGDLNKTFRNKGVFVFNPHINGKLYWEKKDTLIFKPSEPLKRKRTYVGIINIDKLFPKLSDVYPEQEEISFETLGQNLEEMDGYFYPLNEDNNEEVTFKGTIKLLEGVEIKQLRDSISFVSEGHEYRLKVESKNKEKSEFYLESEPLKRATTDKTFTLIMDDKELDLPKSITKEYLLASVKDGLQLVRVEEEKAGRFSKIKLVFSQPLAENRDYKAYINLQPDVDFDVALQEEKLILSGSFEKGEKYRIKLYEGIKSRLGEEIKDDQELDFEVKISDIKPRLEFSNSGVFLPSTKNKKIAFKTINVKRVKAKVKKVEEDDLVEFFEENSYQVNSDSFENYEKYSFKRIGKIIDVKQLDIGLEKNKWIQSQLDLSNVINEGQRGLYIVQLEFDQDDILYNPTEWEDESDWRIKRYLNNSGKKTKHIIISDLGITAKRTSDDTYVFVSDLLTAEPIINAKVILKNDKGHALEIGYTDENGTYRFKKIGEYVEVSKGQDYSILKFDNSELNNSLFDIGGVNSSQKIKAFTYTDRGVYRPGDRINLSLIARNRDNTFPKNHPVTLKLYNPKGKLIMEETNRNAKDGFYTFNFRTKDKALTGDWQAKLKIGGNYYTHNLKIEEVVPYRIKVKIDPSKPRLTLKDEQVDLTLASEYLFGAPAKALDSETEIEIESYPVTFNKYNNFVFNNESMDFKAIKSYKFRNKLDLQGKTDISWKMPKINALPSALRVRINSKVFEKGGRPVSKSKVIPIDLHDRYVGIERLEDSDLEMGTKVKFNIILTDNEGNLISGQNLKYRIYRMQRYWWWEYDSRSAFKRHYKSNSRTELISEGRLTSGDKATELEYNLDNYGEMLLEVEDEQGGHVAGYFFRSYWWGDNDNNKSANTVNIKSDKKKYLPGDEAKIAVKTPKKGKALVTVEKNGQILYRKWEKIESTNFTFKVPVTKDYIPNAYVSVTVLQPYGQLGNDLPLRMYGIMPIKVEDSDSRLDFMIEAPKTIKPEEEFTIKIKNKEERQSQLTIAVVDEGLLDITNFKTPNPWNFFFKKERLLTRTFDNFSDVIGLSWGYIYNVFSIGGGVEAESYMEKQTQAVKTKRFKPVALFKGPIETDDKGHAEVSFKMPNYIGRVKVMVLGADKGSYGSAEESIYVKSPLMVMPTLPRVLGPEDKFKLPVTVFGMEDNLGKVKVKIEIDGPVKVRGASEKFIQFTQIENQDITFDLEVEPTIGPVKIKITADSKEHHTQKIVDIVVRPYNPYTYLSKEKIIEARSKAKFSIPKAGIKNSNSAKLNLSTHKSIKLNHRLKWLIRYPYGCIEQTTSSVFPQLYLSDIFNFDKERLTEIDNNINAGIDRLRKFQLSNGGFSYWPSGGEANEWGSNYAGHFLIEAKQKGYYVPKEMLSKWVSYQTKKIKEKSGDYLTRSYRLYLLALADETALNAMNYLRESRLDEMSNTSKYFLAAAYKLSGFDKIAKDVLKGLDTKVEDYQEFGGTYGSSLRDQAIMLEVMSLVKDYKGALGLYNQIADKISSDQWYSTQTTAYSLLALSKYLVAINDSGLSAKGRVFLADNSVMKFDTNKTVATIPLDNNYGQEIEVISQSNLPIYATLEWEGIPLKDSIGDSSSNLKLTVNWYDEDGNKIDPTEIKQGRSFWGHFRVKKNQNKYIEEMALVQILPSGWEIENMRLLEGKIPDWMNDYQLNHEEYTDIRDDRIMWFFDMKTYDKSYDFVVKINPVTIGEFYLAPTMVEAMYNNDYKATVKGKNVRVIK